jgi:hypothetical protein
MTVNDTAQKFSVRVLLICTVMSLLLSSCGGSGGSSAPAPAVTSTSSISLPTGNNVAAVVVDSGPGGAAGILNVPYVSVTVCKPGTSTCQTIDHILLDTGSYGLRIIATPSLSALNLPAVTDGNGHSVSECAQFVSGVVYGSVHSADIKIAGETALNVPLQEVSDTSAPFATIPTDCSNVGGNFGTVAAMGANGILGIGLFVQDCPACATQVIPATYYGCTTSCSGVKLPLSSQVSNPVASFAVDKNGVSLVLPSVANSGATTLTGALVFGIGTQTNNNIGAATVYVTDASGNFHTTYKTTLLTSSFLDSGSNGLFFNDAAITACTQSTGFYCPASPLALSANNSSSSGTSGVINFTIVNVETLSQGIFAAPVGGDYSATSSSFDWGLPFFFGRTVSVAIEGATTPNGLGPYWAY